MGQHGKSCLCVKQKDHDNGDRGFEHGLERFYGRIWYNSSMLVDEAKIEVEGGHGGAGKASFFKKGRGPDGGNGGKGGDLYVAATTDLFALNRYVGKTHFAAENGESGGSNRKSGHNASDLTISMPVGTEISDLETEEVFEINSPDTKILLCRGGIGGLGNADRACARMTTPIYAQHGLA